MTKVKICGITNLGDARHAAVHGADMLGFNFYRGSKRCVEPSAAFEIVKALDHVRTVGVFVNAGALEIARIVKEVDLDAIQLHGNETSEFIAAVRAELPSVTIIKAVRVDDELRNSALRGFGADHILLDGDAGSDFGGAGKTFDWPRAYGLKDLFLAGGLTPENVAGAIRIVRPYAVDVASGVELSPGRKDPKRVEAFIANAKAA